MTPTEIKAKELVEKFYGITDLNFGTTEQIRCAIQCAIICVEEIIKTESLLSSQDAECYDDLADTMLLDFWQQVLAHLKEM